MLKRSVVVVLFHAVCVVLRLARYNALQVDDGTPAAYAHELNGGAGRARFGDYPLALKMQFGEGWWTRLVPQLWVTGERRYLGQRDPDEKDARRVGTTQYAPPCYGAGYLRTVRPPTC